MIKQEEKAWLIIKNAILLLLVGIAFFEKQTFFQKEQFLQDKNLLFCIICFAAMLVLANVKIVINENVSKKISVFIGALAVFSSIVLSDEIVNRADTNAEVEAISTFEKQPLCLIISLSFALLCFFLLLFLTNRIGIATLVTSALLYILGMLVVVVCDFSGTPFMASDLFTAKTAINVASRYSFKITFFQFASLITIVFFGFMFSELRGVKVINNTKLRLGLFFLVILLSYFAVKQYVLSDFLKDKGIKHFSVETN